MKISSSKTKAKIPKTESKMFVSGQRWQMAHGCAEIVQVGKVIVQYRFFKPGMVRAPLEMKSKTNFAEAMKANKARLIG